MTEAIILVIKCHMVVIIALAFLQIYLKLMNYRMRKRQSEGND